MKIRDRRDKGWFYLDNEYLNGYAKIFGAVGTAVYVSLCRHADNETQKCFPSMKLMAEELSIDEDTISKYIKLFEKNKLVTVIRERDNQTKRWKNNTYVLLDKSEWDSHTEPLGVDSHTELTGKSHTEPFGNKETHSIKETHKHGEVSPQAQPSESRLKEFSIKDTPDKLLQSKNYHDLIIANYWLSKKISFNNSKQYQTNYRREIRVARRLAGAGYSGVDIEKTMNYCENNFGKTTGWTLETVEKKLSDIINKK